MRSPVEQVQQADAARRVRVAWSLLERVVPRALDWGLVARVVRRPRERVVRKPGARGTAG
ncbi:hypothetical protein [Kribbella sp. NPDC051770]|uniref:hypothetical protein n=1 Tax=Kribbella sp. NPDC051770 TaxID=3155413 RepID=UPI003431A71C